MKSKFYVVFDLEPNYSDEHPSDDTYTLRKVDMFNTQLAALDCIDKQTKDYGLTILEVWE